MSTQINKDGFVLIKQQLTSKEKEEIFNYFQQGKGDYGKMTNFIKEVQLPRCSTYLNQLETKTLGTWDLTCTKFRASDNNNSADASTFHKDNVCFKEWMPVLTCLLYLDDAEMSVVPGSHYQLQNTYLQAFHDWNNSKVLEINSGDMLVFYSTLLHRGIFTLGAGSRKLIQVFDCFQNRNVHEQHYFKIAHFLGRENLSGLMINLSKRKFIIPIINFIGYLNASTNYGIQTKTFSKFRSQFLTDDITVIASEGFRNRLEVEEGTMQELNKYIMIEKNTFDVASDEAYDAWRFAMYYRQFYTYLIIFIAIVCFLAVGYDVWKYSMYYRQYYSYVMIFVGFLSFQAVSY